MNWKKWSLLLTIAFAFSLFLAACGGGNNDAGSNNGNDESGNNNAENAEPSGDQTLNINIKT